MGILANMCINLYCDTSSTLDMAHNPVQHNRTKHVSIESHFIREKLDYGVVKTACVPSSNQTTDILIKVVTRTSAQAIDLQVGLRKYPCTNLRGGLSEVPIYFCIYITVPYFSCIFYI